MAKAKARKSEATLKDSSKAGRGGNGLARYYKPFRIDNPESFRLRDHGTKGVFNFGKDEAQDIVEDNRKRLSDLQERLYAQDRWSVLLIFQGMDGAGKDSAIEHVMSGVNPQGCQVVSFKTPSALELDHDFMWRCSINLPERGRIGIFNRSYYEEMLVVRAHPEILARQKLPPHLVTKNIWRERFEDVVAYERYLARNGVLILKFFLNVSPDEQRERFLDRLEQPGKRWKFSMGDIAERALWPKYMEAYEDVVRHSSTPWARWHVVPADQKWAARVIIGSSIVHALDKLDLHYPKVDKASLDEFAHVRDALRAEIADDARGGRKGAKPVPDAGKPDKDAPEKGKSRRAKPRAGTAGSLQKPAS